MNDEIWSVEFIKANPELAYKAIKTLQTLLEDLEEKFKGTTDQQTDCVSIPLLAILPPVSQAMQLPSL